MVRAAVSPGARDDAHGRRARLVDLVGRFPDVRAAVIGDVIADEFVYGRVSRVSREAPVLILAHDRTAIAPGGAGNAARNVASLGGAACLVALVGRGDADRRLERGLGPRVDVSHVVRPRAYRSPVKTRVLAGGVHGVYRQVVRVDRDGPGAADPAVRDAFERAAVAAAAGCHAVLISDYGGGVVTPALVAALQASLSRRRPPAPVLVDSRHDLLAYRGCTACTPNESEVEQALGTTIGDDPERLERAGREVLRRTRAKGVVVTRGSRGMAVFAPRRPTVHIPIFGSDEVADVTGAGDTVIATMTLALAAGASLADAARLANYAGGVAVTKRGTAAVAASEVAAAVRADLDGDRAVRADLDGHA